MCERKTQSLHLYYSFIALLRKLKIPAETKDKTLCLISRIMSLVQL